MGSLIGLVGGLVCSGSCSSALGGAVSVAAWTAGVVLLAAALLALYVRPVALGAMVRPSRLALVAYVACVVGELALISIGSRALDASGDGALRPALIATVVGPHFIPFGWAFHERMFCRLGGFTCGLGAKGPLVGLAHAAEDAAVSAGLVMLIVITLSAAGRFTRHASPQQPASPPGPWRSGDGWLHR